MFGILWVQLRQSMISESRIWIGVQGESVKMLRKPFSMMLQHGAL